MQEVMLAGLTSSTLYKHLQTSGLQSLHLTLQFGLQKTLFADVVCRLLTTSIMGDISKNILFCVSCSLF